MKVFQFRLPERTLISTGRRESDGNQALDFKWLKNDRKGSLD